MTEPVPMTYVDAVCQHNTLHIVLGIPGAVTYVCDACGASGSWRQTVLPSDATSVSETLFWSNT